MIKIALLTAGFAGLLGVAACSSDRALTITTSNESGPTSAVGTTAPPPGITISDNTLPPGLSLPPDLTLPRASPSPTSPTCRSPTSRSRRVCLCHPV